LWKVDGLTGVKGVCFSPDCDVVAVSSRKGICGFYSSLGKPLNKELPLSSPPTSNLLWHEGLNQLALGCANGAACVVFDEDTSRRGGALLALESRSRMAEESAVAAAARPREPEMFANVDYEALAKAQQHTVMSMEEASRFIHQNQGGKSRRALEKQREKRMRSGVSSSDKPLDF